MLPKRRSSLLHAVSLLGLAIGVACSLNDPAAPLSTGRENASYLPTPDIGAVGCAVIAEGSGGYRRMVVLREADLRLTFSELRNIRVAKPGQARRLIGFGNLGASFGGDAIGTCQRV